MDAQPTRIYRLAPRGGPGLVCDDDGLALGALPLTQMAQDAAGRSYHRLDTADAVARALRLAYSPIENEAIARRYRGLSRVARLLSDGEGALARTHAVLLALPEIASDGMAKLAEAAALRKVNPGVADQPRVPAGSPGGGEWVGDGPVDGDDGANLDVAQAAAFTGATLQDKERYVDTRLTAAQKAADQLGVPVENILGVSALESEWGVHPFAAVGNNYFGIHYPAPFATGYVPARDNPKVKVATFASYDDSARAFVAETRSTVQGVSDPAAFAAALQNSGKFGIERDGSKAPTYVSDVAATIRKLRPIIARHGT